ncbi:MAG: ABC transporter substrate-binding protein, partial [Sphaerobacter sp.]|nr:ABC transporter substrate-binding protein [Sphaerobacter sp.]
MNVHDEVHLSDLGNRRATRRTFLARAAVGLTGVVSLPLLAACGGGGGEEGDTATKPAGGQPAGTAQASPGTGKSGSSGEGEPVRGGTLITLGHTDVPGLSPEDAGPTVEWSVITQIHNGLLEVDENYELESVLAERHEVADDGLSYTFTLRKGVKFHDGEEFTSEDVKYSYDWYRNPDNHSIEQTSFAGVESVETPDPYTVVVRMSEPNAAFLVRGATRFIIPAHYHSKVGQETYRTAPIGTGPFKLKEWRAAEYTLLEAFDDHFRGRPYLDEYRLNVVPEASVRAIALETGEAHTSVWQLAAEDNLRLEKSGDFTIFKAPSTSVNHFALNHQRPQLADKAVRQAMMHAIDRQAVIDDVFKGTAVVATSNLAPVLEFWYNPDVKQYPYDPEEAKRILDEAGWKVGADGIREKDG